MGAKPLTALNIVAFPSSCQPLEVLQSILKGGYDKVREAGAVITGGHSIEDQEPKYGLSVTGLVEIENMVTGSGARPGDLLVLTKPIGTGIITTAIKGGLITEEDAHEVIEGMARLNADAAEAMLKAGASACTDITGFSLFGHLYEMLVSSSMGAEIDYSKVPLYPSVLEMANSGMIPAGAYRNLEYMRPNLQWEGAAELKDDAQIILADPQTSGGLLIAIPEKRCGLLMDLLLEKCGGSVIGTVIKSDQPGKIIIS
jgi:selenide,water dikinase